MDAYQIHFSSPVAGVPEWSNNILYRIEAKAEGDPTKEQMRLMVQSLLEDRFKLKMHRESKVEQAYELVVAKSGHKLQQAKDAQGNPLVTLPPPDPDRQKALESGRSYSLSEMKKMMEPGSISIAMKPSGHEFSGKALSMDRFADSLYQLVRSRVINKTDLSGLYDIEFVYANPYSLNAAPGDANTAPAAEISAPNIFKALQDQLGLKLESTKAPSEHFVVDNMEKPLED